MIERSRDIFGLGVSTVDDLLIVESLPRGNEKQRVLSYQRQCGGLTGSALVAAARMGCRCLYGVTLGTGELSGFMRRELGREGVAVIESPDFPEAEPFHSIIIIEKKTGERSILWDNTRSRPPAIGERERILAANAGCLFVDHVYAAELLDIARQAREAGTPVVGDFERTTPHSLELMELTDHLIVPLAYARLLLGPETTPEAAVRSFVRASGRKLACITDGCNGSWYGLGGGSDRVFHQPVFPMKDIVDTTGCGDVFHGVYAAGLVLGWPPAERIRRAAAAAALKTRKTGAQAGAPTLEELERFLGGQ